MTPLQATAPKPEPIWLQKYPQYVQWDAPLDVFTMVDLWKNAVAKFAHKDVIAYMGTHITYGQLDKDIELMKSRLHKMGVCQGDHVGLCLVNTPWYFIAYYAVLAVGGVVVNFNPLYAQQEVNFQTKDSQIKHMITLDLDMLYSKVGPLLNQDNHLQSILVLPFAVHLPPLKRVLFNVLKRGAMANFAPSDRVHTPRSLGNDLSPVPSLSLSVDDLAVLQYTGGTTGRSKGAMLSHKNLSANISQARHWFHTIQEGEERMACFLPLFHVFAMNLCMNFNISFGGCALMQPRFELQEAIKFMSKEKCTIFAAVPTIYNALIQRPAANKQGLKHIRLAVCGGAPLSAEIKTQFEQQMGLELLEGYGLSETSPVASANPFDGTSQPLCVGVPVPHTEFSLRCLDRPNVQVPKGERGEICIRGPQVMQGYWNRPEATQEAFTKDGFFRTGDVGYFDQDNGFCYIVDRIKDLILCGGYNVYPRHIEEALYQHPDVLETIVIGVPDDYRGETPKAFIKLRETVTTPPTKQEILDFLKDKLSPIERPSDIEFRDDLPKTIIGKLSKKDLREEL